MGARDFDAPATGDELVEDAPDLSEKLPLSTREQLAVYAIRGALLGILFVPIEFYVLYLVFKVFVSDEPLGARYRDMSFVAALIMLISLGGWYAIIRPS